MKPQIKVVRFRDLFHVALFSKSVKAQGMKYLSLTTTYTEQAGEEWISRIRGMRRSYLISLLQDAVYMPHGRGVR